MKIYGINKKTLVVEAIETEPGQFQVKETPELAFRSSEGEAYKVLADEIERRIALKTETLKSLQLLKLAVFDRLVGLGIAHEPGLFDEREREIAELGLAYTWRDDLENHGGDVENGVELT